jgi:ribose-phosphate pyrophosphokinase
MDIEILENVRGQDVFIIQSTSTPAADNLMELLVMADALRRASAGRITAVMPYFGFARQDRRVRSSRTPITAKVVADMLSKVGINRVVTMDLHSDQIQGFFYIPVDNVYSTPIILSDIRAKKFNNIMIVSPDIGGIVRARAFIKHLPGAELSIIDTRRPRPNEAQVMHVIGEVSGYDCVIIDDILDTAGTLRAASDFLKSHGATSVTAYVTHPVLSGNAIANINESQIDEIIVTNTIALKQDALDCPKIRQLDISKMMAEVMRRVSDFKSLSSLYI